MHHANYYYGHAHVLARYCGLTDPAHPPRMLGYLQHGWNIGDGMAPGVPLVNGSPMFVWSEETRRRSISQGRRNVLAIGAPFAYLTEMTPAPEKDEREGTIFYPFHGWEGQQVMGDHRRLIDEVRSVEDGPVTVCLYWNEHRVRGIRRLYEKAGFRVICHGYRGFWWREHDRDFLDRQLIELRRHRRVVSNRLCSAIWYGLLAGADAAVYGDPMVLEDGDLTFGGEPRLRRQWPEVYGYTTDRETCLALARRELGADNLARPTELRHALGWAEPLERCA
ncbi:hypothetical protein ACIA8K_28665 [Catenuloplanes sp. NPDC051500]|uniref:hypothetical protein n=1 Tax=Catenuloplanes sp. NPDC051500 TaxID=3363959 RepID=UPI0037A7940A